MCLFTDIIARLSNGTELVCLQDGFSAKKQDEHAGIILRYFGRI